MSLHIVILAAGRSTRMLSCKPKVMHFLAGKPMLARVIETALQLQPEAIHVVYNPDHQDIKQAFPQLPLNWVPQEQQLGTGHAVMQALPSLPLTSHVLILPGDVPLIQVSTLETLLKTSIFQSQPVLGLLLATLDNPNGLGRVLRDANNKIYAIIEDKDATLEQKNIKEIYTGICLAATKDLLRWLPALHKKNTQNEYYLTDIVQCAAQEHYFIGCSNPASLWEIKGVNNRLQLNQLEREWQILIARQLLLSGVSIADCNRFDVRGELRCAQDVFIDINSIFSGIVTIGAGTRIGPNCILNNVTIGENCEIFANSILDGCQIAHNCQIGPFARLRPNTILNTNCKIGNFVETKNATFATGCKANHLSYLGDVEIGKYVNIGAGTITCNYDGVNKFKTIIKEGAFIGSDTQLIAPVTIGEYATIGAGSTISKDAPPGKLTITERKQKIIVGWERPDKQEKL